MNAERRQCRRGISLFCLALVTMLPPALAAEDPSGLSRAVDRARPAVVYVEPMIELDTLIGSRRIRGKCGGRGSGALVSADGLVCSAAHVVRVDRSRLSEMFAGSEFSLSGVVSPSGEIVDPSQGITADGQTIFLRVRRRGSDEVVPAQTRVSVTLDKDGPRQRTFGARPLYVDDEYDFAVLQVVGLPEEGTSFLQMGDCKQVPHGCPVAVLGHPGGGPFQPASGTVWAVGTRRRSHRDRGRAKTKLTGTSALGVLIEDIGEDIVAKAYREVIGEDLPVDREGATEIKILISAGPSGQGQSGGPVIDAQGRIIGVLSAGLTGGRGVLDAAAEIERKVFAEPSQGNQPDAEGFQFAVATDVIKERLADRAPSIASRLGIAGTAAGASPREKADPALMEQLVHAVTAGDISAVDQLLAQGADVNGRSPRFVDDGGQPLHIAAEHGNRDMAECLLAHGADVNGRDDSGKTPLHVAARSDPTLILALFAASGEEPRGHGKVMELMELLLSRQADINATDQHGETPLHGAAYKGRARVVELLLSKGAEVNARDNDGWTPLHKAAYLGGTMTAERLLSAGADVNARTGDGETALCIAERRHMKVSRVLRSHGGTE